MSYLSTSENVGFSGIPQKISDASCATQYKMAVEGVAGNCDVNMFIHDSSGDEQPYITHMNDNFFHTKFKIDPNELYTFHDSDVIANEITVSHTEDNMIFTESADVKPKYLDSPSKEIDLIGAFTNGEVKTEVKKEIVSNGHYPSKTKTLSSIHRDVKTQGHKDCKTQNTKVPKAKTQTQAKELFRANVVNEMKRPSIHSPKGLCNNAIPSTCTTTSISSDNTISLNASAGKPPVSETFLDVFKREQGLESLPVVVKTESPGPSAPPPAKTPSSTSKKAVSGKTASQPKARRGRGPAVHEALQRIPVQKRAVPVPNRAWHAPGHSLFQCGPLNDKKFVPFRHDSSSSDEDNLPDIEVIRGPICVEESAAESRSARLALRSAALRRQVARADTALRLAGNFRQERALASMIKKQLDRPGASSRMPTPIVNHLLAKRGMPAVLDSQERRRLREDGWSGGERGTKLSNTNTTCAEDKCSLPPLPCSQYCLSHITQAPEQRLYAACAAVFAGGSRCMQPLLQLEDQTPLCVEHAWKRDNYEKLNRDFRPKKAIALVRKRIWAPPPRPPRRAKRRRRPPAKSRPLPTQSLSEINVCSNSSAYDSSEDTNMGAVSENEYIASTSNSHELEVEEVGHVPHDDILDPTVLSQMPDEAFTEFFNQSEGSAPFAESSELAAALEAVLDERVLDERALDTIGDCVFTPQQAAKSKVQEVSTSSSMPPDAS